MPMPLPPMYDLDLNPIELPAPGAGSFQELESLALKWRLEGPDELRCHPAIAYAITRTAPPQPCYSLAEHKALIGLKLTVDSDMPCGGWEILAAGELLESGIADVTD